MKIYHWGSSDRIPALWGQTEEVDDLIYKYYDSFPPPSNQDWVAPVLVPRKGAITEKKIGDFPVTSSLAHLVSQRALDALGDIFEANGVLYPVVIKDVEQKYYIYLCSNVVDCLNEKESNVWYAEHTDIDPPACVGVLKHVWHEDKVGSNEVFVIPQDLSHIHVTDSFIEKIRAAKLKKFVYCNETVNVTETDTT